MNPRNAINFAGLAALIRGHRESQGLTLREAGERCGVSSSTLSRIERAEARPDLDTVQLLVDWVGVPLAKVVSQAGGPSPRRTSSRKQASPLEEVEIQFRADPNLDPQAAEALIEIVRSAYKAIRKTPGGDG